MKVDLLAQAKALPIDDQIALAEAICDAIVDNDSVPPPTAAQQEELARPYSIYFRAEPARLTP
jgi:putative addiction module component (TIGR02574 family)